MKSTFTPLLVLVSLCCFAQDHQKDINAQVWIPFIDSFNQRNNEGFMAVHSKDLIRVPRESKIVLNFDQYKKENADGNSRSQSKQTIELRFLERIANENQAFEVGIYKTTVADSNGKSREFYGKFHVVHRKENGIWKILVDSDSSEGGTIGEKNFLEAKPMQ